MITLAQLATPARTVESDASPMEAARLMERHHVGSLVVVGDGMPMGMVSDRDLALRVLLDDEDDVREVAQCMSAPLETCSPDLGLGEASQLMRRGRIRRLALVGPDGALAGVVSADDLLRHVGTQIGFLSTAIGRELQAEAERAQGSSTFGRE